MGYKVMVLALFAASVFSLMGALFFLLRDQGNRRRTLNALIWRVLFSVLLLATLLYGVYFGHLQPHG